MLDTTRPVNNSSANTPEISFTNGLYWRKNWWNGAECRPSIVSLNGDHFTVVTNKHVTVVDLKIKDIKSVEFSSYGMKIITHEGVAYSLLCMGSKISPVVPKDQILHLTNQGLLATNHGTLDRLGIQYIERKYNQQKELICQFGFGKTNVLIWGYIFYVLGVPVVKHPVLKMANIRGIS